MIRMIRNIGEIVTERGGLMKIGLMALLIAINHVCVAYNGGFVSQDETGGIVYNLPQLLLCLLLACIGTGFYIGIIQNRMNSGEGFLPRLDFSKYMISTICTIPFFIVWGIYLAIFMAFVVLLSMPLRSAPFAAIVIFGLCCVIMFLMINFAFVAIYYLHVANFSYKHVLNPFSVFSVLPNVALPIFGLSIVYALIVIIGSYIGAFLVSAVGIDFLKINTAMVLTFIIYLVLLTLLQSAYIARIADLVREKLENTEFAECFKVVDDMPEGFDRYAYRNPSDEQ